MCIRDSLHAGEELTDTFGFKGKSVHTSTSVPQVGHCLLYTSYIIGMAIAFAVAFALSLTLKYKTDAE